jgi:hypothetical protein
MPSPNKTSDNKGKPPKNLLLFYSGMAAQFLVIIGLMVFAGLIFKVVRDTSK